jgi:ornithine decarboxylase
MPVEEKQYWANLLNDLTYKTPFLVTDLECARNNVRTLKKLMPRVGIYYAIKSNSDSSFIKAIDGLVDGYDIASYGECSELESIGVPARRMVYSNPVKIPEHIKKSYKRGVDKFAFDSVDEIKKLAKYAPGSKVYLRIKVSDYGSKFPLSRKFGADPKHALSYLETAADMGLVPFGITFHVGSQSENVHTWQSAFETSGEIFEKARRIGMNLNFLNIGGGFPAQYTDRIISLEELAKTINLALKKHIPDDVRVIAEPGRNISANTSALATTVIAREYREGSNWLYLDMGVFQGLMEPLEMSDWKYPVFSETVDRGSKLSQSFVLSGPTCDAYDTIGLDYKLPSGIKMGQRIYIGAVGAYSLVYKSSFNGFKPPKVYYINA